MLLVAASPLATWFHRFLIALVLASVTALGAVGSGWAYLNAKWANANDVDLELDGGPTANFLVLGSDSREFVDSDEDEAAFGTVGGRRADTIIVVRVDPDTRKALLVSFPRDLWVEIPGRGSNRINSAFQDGPQGVVDTMRHNFDIPIHHYVEVDFSGFRNIVNSMGGVTMYVPAPSRDPKSGLNIEEAGCTVLDGEQALGWVRSRNFQSYESGTWRSDPTGDFGRIQRQQDFLRRLISQAIESGARNPIRGDNLIDAGLENITVDTGLSVSDVLKLVGVFRSGDPEDVEMLTIPAVVGRRGSASVVLATGEAESVYERLRGDSPLDLAAVPSQTTIRVLNGVGTSGLATRTSSDLLDHGFLPGGVGDSEPTDTTEIRYKLGAEEKAELVRSYLGGVGELVEDETIGDVDVLLVLGSDFDGVVDPDGGEEALGDLLPIAAVHGQDAQEDGESEGTGSEESPDC